MAEGGLNLGLDLRGPYSLITNAGQQDVERQRLSQNYAAMQAEQNYRMQSLGLDQQRIQVQQQQADQARDLEHMKLLWQAANSDPDLAQIQVNMIKQLRQSQNLPTSQAMLDYAQKLKPEDGGLLEHLPSVKMLMQNPSKAMRNPDIGTLGQMGVELSQARRIRDAWQQDQDQQPPDVTGPGNPPGEAIPQPSQYGPAMSRVMQGRAIQPTPGAPPQSPWPTMPPAGQQAGQPGGTPSPQQGGPQGGPSPASGPSDQSQSTPLQTLDDQVQQINRAIMETSAYPAKGTREQAQQKTLLDALKVERQTLETRRQELMKGEKFEPNTFRFSPATGQFTPAPQPQGGPQPWSQITTPTGDIFTAVPNVLKGGIPEYQKTTAGEQTQLAQQRLGIAGRMLNLAEGRATSAQVKQFVEPLQKQVGLMGDLQQMDKLYDSMNAKGLVPGDNASKIGMTLSKLKREWLNPTDPDVVNFKQLIGPFLIGEVDRGAFDEKGGRALAQFSSQLKLGEDMPSATAFKQYTKSLRDSIGRKMNLNAKMAKENTALTPDVQSMMQSASDVLNGGEAPNAYATPTPSAPPSFSQWRQMQGAGR
jgi:hypothetical protein